MNRSFDDLLREALASPSGSERVRALIDSLDSTVDPEVEGAWDAEIGRRTREFEEGGIAPMAWDEVKRRLMER